MVANFSTLCVALVTLCAGFQSFGTSQQINNQEQGWDEFLYVNDASAVKHTFGGPLVTNFVALKIRKGKFEELCKEAKNDDSLLELLKRMKQRKHAVGIAVFLNQRYPDKLFNPITHAFSVDPTSNIPVDFSVAETKEVIHVSPEVFGQICYAYWSRELEVGEFRHLKIKE